MTGDIILQSQPYPVQGNTNKAISYNRSRAIFLSKKEGGQMESVLDMNGHYITNVRDPVNTDHVVNKGYVDTNFLNKNGGVLFGPLSMNNNDLIRIPDNPKFSSSAVNKKYVDTRIATVDTNQFVLKSGSTMTVNLDMDSNFVRDVGIDLADDSAAIPKLYIDARLNNIISYPITADINMSNHKITNLKSPTTNTDGSTKGYVDQKISESHDETSDKTNVFKYLNDPIQTSSEQNITVNSFGDWTNSPHKYNKGAYDVTLQTLSGADSYNSILGINLYSAGAGKFTLVFEFHYPTEMSNIIITSIASTASINKQTKRKFIDHI